MPEGDTVWLTARRLDQALAGDVLTAADLRVPALATADLRGRRVLGVAARGKHLLLRASARPGDAVDGGLTLHTHLGMEGSWHLYPAGGPRAGGPEWQIRVLLRTARRQAVGYRLRTVDLVPTVGEDAVVGHLGPDLLDPAWGPALRAEAVRRLLAPPAEQIGAALLDQRRLAGLGTLYRSEALFLQGTSPWTATAEVPDLAGLVERGHRLLAANRLRATQVTTGADRPGRRTWVFERAGRPCRRCGTAIRLARQGPPGRERPSYWCPRCQPTPGA